MTIAIEKRCAENKVETVVQASNRTIELGNPYPILFLRPKEAKQGRDGDYVTVSFSKFSSLRLKNNQINEIDLCKKEGIIWLPRS